MSDNQRGKKLAYFLRRMDEKRLAELEEYLRSPLFANSPQMAELLAACLRFMEEESLDLQKVHSAVFPAKKWDQKRSKYLQLRVVQLLNHLLDYHALAVYREDEAVRYLFRLSAGIRQDWESYIPFMYSQALRNLPEEQGASGMLAALQLETRYNGYLSRTAVVGSDTHLDQVHQALDMHFLVQKLKYATASANLAMGTGHALKDELLDLVLNYVDGLPSGTQYGLVRAYSHAFRMITHLGNPESESAEEHFHRLREYFEDAVAIDKSELLDLMNYAINYCTVRIHQGRASYIPEIKQIYEQVLEKGLLLEGGLMSAGHFKNIVNIMCRFRELDWVEGFVEEYRLRIASDQGQLAYLYNKAVIAFHRGDFAGTVRLLYHRIHEFTDILFGIAARNYLCRALWNQGEFQWLGSNLAAFRVYLKRQTDLSDQDRKMNLLYVKCFEQILNARTMNPDRSRQKLESIRERLLSSKEGSVFQSLHSILGELLD